MQLDDRSRMMPKNKQKKPKYSSGQNGKSLRLGLEEMNPKERHVIEVLHGATDRITSDLDWLSRQSFPSQTLARANSWVRNSVRRLVRGDWVERTASGTYRLNARARKRLGLFDKLVRKYAAKIAAELAHETPKSGKASAAAVA